MMRAFALVALLLVAGRLLAAEPECDAQCVAAKEEGAPIHRLAPKYPKAALRHRVEGCIVVSFEITPQGLADKVQVLDSQPKGVFDAVTLKALKDWRFKVPVNRPGRYSQRLDYRMEASSKPLPCMAAPGYDALNGVVTPVPDVHLLQGSLPAFPPDVSADGGCVTLKILVKHDGFVGDVQVLDARPAELAGPMAEAVKHWWFDSFPPPDRVAIKTLNFVAGEQVKLPDTMIRTASGAVDDKGGLANQGCVGKKS